MPLVYERLLKLLPTFFLSELLVAYVIQGICLFYVLLNVLVYLFIAFPQVFRVCWAVEMSPVSLLTLLIFIITFSWVTCIEFINFTNFFQELRGFLDFYIFLTFKIPFLLYCYRMFSTYLKCFLPSFLRWSLRVTDNFPHCLESFLEFLKSKWIYHCCVYMLCIHRRGHWGSEDKSVASVLFWRALCGSPGPQEAHACLPLPISGLPFPAFLVDTLPSPCTLRRASSLSHKHAHFHFLSV